MEPGGELDLVRAELEERVGQVTDPDAAETFGTYVFASDEPGAELGRYLERLVFGEFFGNTPELLAEEYDPYEAASVFFCVVDHRRHLPAGVLRVIGPSDAGFKTLDDIERVWGQPVPEVLARTGIELDRARLWDVATLAVHPEYRGAATSGLVALGLYQGLTHGAVLSGIERWVTVLDAVVLELIQNQCVRPFDYFRGVGPMNYLDSPASVPVWSDLPSWRERAAATDASMHGILFEGRGIEAAIAPRYVDQLEVLAARGVPVGPGVSPTTPSPAPSPMSAPAAR